MSNRSTHISIPTDPDGFLSMECPFCIGRFKLEAGEAHDYDFIVVHCPICGLNSDPNNFWTSNAVEAAQIAAMNLAREVINDSMKDWEHSFKRMKGVSLKRGAPLKPEADKVLLELPDLELEELECCHKSVKVNPLDKSVGVYCPYCGLAN